jgi:hypothetical protein
MDQVFSTSEKLQVIAECTKYLSTVMFLNADGDEKPNANDLVPALNYLVLRAAPPNLHANIQ